MIRVVLAEDSPTVRALLMEILCADPEVLVVGEAKNGVEAVELTLHTKPDVVAMDISMPLMNGLETTKELMLHSPRPIVLFTSTFQSSEVALALSATRAGALAVLDKPDDVAAPDFEERQLEFVRMIKAMAKVKVVGHQRHRVQEARLSTRRVVAANGRCVVIAIAASTGGPSALVRVLSELPATLAVPVLIVQHIAHGFTVGLVDWLNASCGLPVRLAVDGETLQAGVVYLPPDDRHLQVRHGGKIELSAAPAIKGFRPSATALFRSVAEVYGARVAGVILTGMGDDGVDGLRPLHAAGSLVIAQDEATSVVFGMPQKAVAAGVVHDVLPIDRIGARLLEHLASVENVHARPSR